MAINDDILAAAAALKKGEAEGHKYERHSLPEMIAAAEYLAKQEGSEVSATKPHFGLRMTKLIPPGGG